MLAAADHYTVEGKLVYELKRADGSSTPLERPFRVTCGARGWEIKVETGTTNIGTFYYQYNPPYMFSFGSFAQGSAEPSGILERNPVPQSWTSAGGEYVWLAYASADYFGSLAPGDRALFLHPIKSGSGLVRREELPCVWTLGARPPQLPRRVEYLRDMSRVLVRSDLVLTNPLPAPFQRGYTQAVFESSGLTNVNGLSLPTAFEYREYMPRRGASSSGELDCFLIVRGVATNFDCTTPLAFHVPQKAHVRDDRVPEAGVHYWVSNGVAPELDDAYVVAQRVDALKKAPLRAQKPAPTRPVALLFVLFVVLSPLAYYFLWRGRARRHSYTAAQTRASKK
jgi:hypothetical protein